MLCCSSLVIFCVREASKASASRSRDPSWASFLPLRGVLAEMTVNFCDHFWVSLRRSSRGFHLSPRSHRRLVFIAPRRNASREKMHVIRCLISNCSLCRQGEKNAGFEVLYHNHKNSLVSIKELLDFFRERFVQMFLIYFLLLDNDGYRKRKSLNSNYIFPRSRSKVEHLMFFFLN